MILTKDERKQVYQDWLNSETLTDEDGLIQLAETALLEKLHGGVELPAPTARFNWNLGKFEWLVTFKHSEHHLKPLYTHDQLLAYGAAQRLAGRERAIEECAAECLVLHANGNYKHDTREDCHDAIRALAASPQEQT